MIAQIAFPQTTPVTPTQARAQHVINHLWHDVHKLYGQPYAPPPTLVASAPIPDAIAESGVGVIYSPPGYLRDLSRMKINHGGATRFTTLHELAHAEMGIDSEGGANHQANVVSRWLNRHLR